MRRRAMLLASAAVVAAVGAAAVIVSTGQHNDSPASTPALPTSSAVASETPGTATGFADPVTDVLGRKMMVPLNPAGQILAQREPGARGECSGAAPVAAPEGTMIQRSFELPILLSVTDGPARLDGTVLTGYRHSVQGAVLAGWNYLARVYAGGAPARDTMLAMALLSEAERAKLGAAPTATATENPTATRFRTMFTAPDGFRVLSCDADFAAIELSVRVPADPGTNSDEGWGGIRLNLLWRDGDWRLQIPSDRAALGVHNRYPSLDGWTRWPF